MTKPEKMVEVHEKQHDSLLNGVHVASKVDTAFKNSGRCWKMLQDIVVLYRELW